MTGERLSPRPCAPIEQDQRRADHALVDFGRLVADLRSLDVRRGQDLLALCSMRQVGPVDGGAPALLAAIQDVALRSGYAGMGMTRWVPVRTTVDFAVDWLAGHRNWVEHDK